MICKSCGNVVSDEAKFCTECGAQTDNNETAAEKEALSAETAPAENAPESSPEETVASSEDTISEVSETAAEEENAPVSEPAPVIVEYSTSVTEPAVNEEKPPVKVGAGRIFGASLVSLLAIVFITLTGLLLSAKIGLSGNVLKNRADDMNISAVLDSDMNDEVTASEYIYNNIGSAILGKKDIQPKDLRSFLIRAEFEDFIGETLDAYAGYIVDGNDKIPSVTSEDFVQFFRDNEDIARKEFGEPFSESDYSNMAVRLKNRGLDDALSVDEWSDRLGFNAGNLSYIFSYLTLGIVAAIALFMLVWIAIIVDKRSRHLTGFYGNTALISGLIMFIPSAAFLAGASAIAFSTNTTAAYLAAELLVPFTLVLLCTGAFWIIIGVIFKLIRKFIVKKEAAKQ